MFNPVLNAYKNIQCLTAKDPDEIIKILSGITMPFQIVSIYAIDKVHYCWISPTQKVKIEKKKKITKE